MFRFPQSFHLWLGAKHDVHSASSFLHGAFGIRTFSLAKTARVIGSLKTSISKSE